MAFLRWMCSFGLFVPLLTNSQLRAQAAKASPRVAGVLQSAASPDQAGQNAKSAEAAAGVKGAVQLMSTSFTSRSQLVLIPVVVTDKNGKHIGGLGHEAFKIEEHGKSREVTIFEEVKTVAPDTNSRPLKQPEGRINFAFDNTQSWRMTMVVMDLLNTPYLYQNEGKQRLIAFLSKSLEREEPTTLFGLDRNGLRQLHSFTTDTSVLIAALKKLQGQEGSDEAGEEESALVKVATDASTGSTVRGQSAIGGDAMQQIANFMNDTVARSNAIQERTAIRNTLTAMRQIAHAYAAIPGRKTMVWTSGGFPFMIDDPDAFARMGTDMEEMYKETWRDLISANIAVYTVDVTGLIGSIGDIGKDKPSARFRSIMSRTVGSTSANSTIPYDKSMQKQNTLIAFADATGGVPCLGTDDLERCFARAVEDSRAYYMLGYYLPSDDRKPGWRKLKVKVAVEGARARAREGFYVSKPAKDTAELRRRQLVDAFLSPVEFTGVRLKVREVPASTEAKAATGKTMHEFEVGILGNSGTVDTQNENAVDLTVISVAVGANQKNAGQTEQHVSAKLPPETLAKIRLSALGVRESLELAPGKYELRTVVRDNLNGKVGSVEYPLEVK
jgi:VWFA-related protein